MPDIPIAPTPRAAQTTKLNQAGPGQAPPAPGGTRPGEPLSVGRDAAGIIDRHGGPKATGAAVRDAATTPSSDVRESLSQIAQNARNVVAEAKAEQYWSRVEEGIRRGDNARQVLESIQEMNEQLVKDGHPPIVPGLTEEVVEHLVTRFRGFTIEAGGAGGPLGNLGILGGGGIQVTFNQNSQEQTGGTSAPGGDPGGIPPPPVGGEPADNPQAPGPGGTPAALPNPVGTTQSGVATHDLPPGGTPDPTHPELASNSQTNTTGSNLPGAPPKDDGNSPGGLPGSGGENAGNNGSLTAQPVYNTSSGILGGPERSVDNQANPFGAPQDSPIDRSDNPSALPQGGRSEPASHGETARREQRGATHSSSDPVKPDGQPPGRPGESGGRPSGLGGAAATGEAYAAAPGKAAPGGSATRGGDVAGQTSSPAAGVPGRPPEGQTGRPAAAAPASGAPGGATQPGARGPIGAAGLPAAPRGAASLAGAGPLPTQSVGPPPVADNVAANPGGAQNRAGSGGMPGPGKPSATGPGATASPAGAANPVRPGLEAGRPPGLLPARVSEAAKETPPSSSAGAPRPATARRQGEAGPMQAIGFNERIAVRSALREVDATRQRMARTLKDAGHLLTVVGTRALTIVEQQSLRGAITVARDELKAALASLKAMQQVLDAKGSGLSPAQITAGKHALKAVESDLKARLKGLDLVHGMLEKAQSAKAQDPKILEAVGRLLASLGLNREGKAERHERTGSLATASHAAPTAGNASGSAEVAGRAAKVGDGGAAEEAALRAASAELLAAEQVEAAQTSKESEEEIGQSRRRRSQDAAQRQAAEPERRDPRDAVRDREGNVSEDEKVQVARFRFLQELRDREAARD
ncbi:MAG: hypothetical protein FJZ01_24550 [Candidatus Sericytochromatia bacterium]|nr:hypothetical protein [Candidatus Tanganyikabacteria bacterium]